MELYLVQHGEAYPEDLDPERRLTDRGRMETERIARYLYSIGAKPGKILHSGKTRAKETAEILAKYLESPVEKAEGLNPRDDPKPWAERLNSEEESLMIVGHLPFLERLVATLLGTEEPPIRFRYSGVAKMVRSEGGWRIEWFITPEVVP